MYKFKQLEWYPQDGLNGFYAEPDGLKWSYSILVLEDGQVELSLLDPYYEYAPKFPQVCKSIDEAKKKAAKYYFSLLERFVA